MFRLNPKDAAAAFEACPKNKLAADSLAFGERQVQQMLKDRPLMAHYGDKAKPLYQWAARKFAGEDLDNKIQWNGTDPVRVWNAESGALELTVEAANLPPGNSPPRFVRVRRTCNDGPDAGKERCFEALWHDAVFELYNNAAAKDFDRVIADAAAGKLSPHEYAKRTLEVEGKAAEKTRAFYIHVFLPWAQKNHAVTHPEYWSVAVRSDPSQNLFLATIGDDDPHWRYYEFDCNQILLASLEQQGKTDKAVEMATKMLTAARTNEEKVALYLVRGPLYVNRGDTDKGIADFTEAIRLTPKDAVAYRDRGMAHLNKGDFDKALADLSAAIRLDPSDASAYFFRGFAEEHKGDLKRAIADLTEAIRLNPAYAEAYRNRGWAYGEQGNFDKALVDLTATVRLAPNDPDAQNCLAACKKKRDHEEVIAHFDAVIRANPKNAEAYQSRAMVYVGNSDFDKAIADYAKAIELRPTPEAYTARAAIHANKGQCDKAIADYNNAIRLASKSAPLYVCRGTVYFWKGDFAQALADARAAVKLDPKNAEARDLREMISQRTAQIVSRGEVSTTASPAASYSPSGFNATTTAPAAPTTAEPSVRPDFDFDATLRVR